MTRRTPSAAVPSNDFETNSRSSGPCERTTSRASPSTNLSHRAPSSTATLRRQPRATLTHIPRHGRSEFQSIRPSHRAHSRNRVSACRQPVDVAQSSVAAVTVSDASRSASSRARVVLIARVTSLANRSSTPSSGSSCSDRRRDLTQAACLTSSASCRPSVAVIPKTCRRTTSENSSSKNRVTLFGMST